MSLRVCPIYTHTGQQDLHNHPWQQAASHAHAPGASGLDAQFEYFDSLATSANDDGPDRKLLAFKAHYHRHSYEGYSQDDSSFHPGHRQQHLGFDSHGHSIGREASSVAAHKKWNKFWGRRLFGGAAATWPRALNAARSTTASVAATAAAAADMSVYTDFEGDNGVLAAAAGERSLLASHRVEKFQVGVLSSSHSRQHKRRVGGVHSGVAA